MVMPKKPLWEAVVDPLAQASHPDWRLRSFISEGPEWSETSAGWVTLYWLIGQDARLSPLRLAGRLCLRTDQSKAEEKQGWGGAQKRGKRKFQGREGGRFRLRHPATLR